MFAGYDQSRSSKDAVVARRTADGIGNLSQPQYRSRADAAMHGCRLVKKNTFPCAPAVQRLYYARRKRQTWCGPAQVLLKAEALSMPVHESHDEYQRHPGVLCSSVRFSKTTNRPGRMTTKEFSCTMLLSTMPPLPAAALLVYFWLASYASPVSPCWFWSKPKIHILR